MKIPVTGQGDFFVSPEIVRDELRRCDGRAVKRDAYGDAVVTLIGSPRWREDLGEWVGLANVAGMLCLVSVRIYAEVEA